MEPNTNSEADMSSTVNDLRNEGVDIVGQEGPEPTGGIPEQRGAMPDAPVPTPTLVSEQRQSTEDKVSQTIGETRPSPQAVSSQNDPSVKSLRTFKSDAEEAVRYKNVSTAQIALAEQNKRLARQESEPRSMGESRSPSIGRVFLAGTLILILAGGGAYYYWSVIMRQEQSPAAALPQELRIQTIIPYAKASLVRINPRDNPLNSVGVAMGDAIVAESSIHAIVSVPNGTSTTLAMPLEVFGQTRMPDMLKRSLSQTYMLGIYANGPKAPFFILKNTYFQNAFAGMLEWERNMRNDLMPLITVSHPEETATLVNSLAFEDAVISNTDARVLKNGNGGIVLAYAFADQSTIVVTTDADTLKKLLDKILAVRVVQ